MYRIDSVIGSLSSSIQAAERLVGHSGSATAYDAAYQSLLEALAEDWIADSLATTDHAILVVELQDIQESVARTRSLPFAYGRIVEFSRFTLKKLEARRETMGMTC